MPSAVWQGFCSLLKGPPRSLPAQCCMNRPYFWWFLGGHCASLGLSKASMTALESHQGHQNGLTCLQDGPR